MSRIQAAFDALGRELLDSEMPAVDAFNAKYRNSHATEAAESVRQWIGNQFPEAAVYPVQMNGLVVLKGMGTNGVTYVQVRQGRATGKSRTSGLTARIVDSLTGKKVPLS